jgi:hypothetical protein
MTESKMPVYHPLSVCGYVDSSRGNFTSGFSQPGIHDPEYGSSFPLRNTLGREVFVAGIRALNNPWDCIILQIGPIKGPFDAAAFNLDAVPGAPVGMRHPTPERPRFVHYPMGTLAPDEELLVRAVPYGSPAQWPLLNLLVFVELLED